jgi:hypothetical protein
MKKNNHVEVESMSEGGDYDPGPWRGYDFKSARKKYDVHAGRSYDDAVATNKKLDDLVPKELKTDSESPLVIACDVTGSMGEWPAVIFSKLPYLDLEGQEYLGKTMEISFAAVGDAYCDKYPLQVQQFAKGKDLEKRLKELVIEGGGGGQIMESYDLAALYYARNVEMPNAIHPIFIFIGDESMYDYVDKQHAQDCTRNTLDKRMTAGDVIKELQSKYSVYLIRKPYEQGSSRDGMSDTDKKIYKQWEKYLGEDHISILPEAGRVVDVIFGILANETSRVEYFKGELEGRQKPDQVKTVLKALETIHDGADKDAKEAVPLLAADTGKSVMKRSKDTEKAKSLL